MNKDDYNAKAMTDVYKNAHIAMQSISDVLPDVKDRALKTELNRQFKGYKSFIKGAQAFMGKNGIPADDINVFKKGIMFCAIKMKTAMDSSRNNIAEMLMKGTLNGVTELTAMANETENIDEDVIGYVKKLLELEETYMESLKKFL